MAIQCYYFGVSSIAPFLKMVMDHMMSCSVINIMSWSCYDNILSQVGEVRASVMDTVMDHMMDLDTLDTGEEADNGDDMDEMNMPNPGKWGY